MERPLQNQEEPNGAPTRGSSSSDLLTAYGQTSREALAWTFVYIIQAVMFLYTRCFAERTPENVTLALTYVLAVTLPLSLIVALVGFRRSEMLHARYVASCKRPATT